MDEQAIIDRLIDEGLLAPRQVARVRERAGGTPLREALIAQGLITAEDWPAPVSATPAAAAAVPAGTPVFDVAEKLAKAPTFDDLLGDLTMADIRAFSTILNAEEFTLGASIFREGDTGEKLHIVKSGTVHIIKGGAPVAELATGDLLGEMSFILGWARTARAVADGPVELLTINKKDFLRFCGRYPLTGLKIVLGLITVICYRLQAVELALAALPAADPATLRYDPDQGLTWAEVDEMLNAEEAADLRVATSTAEYPAGAVIFTQGSPGHELYAIRHGEVAATCAGADGQPVPVAKFGDGYVFGEAGFVLGWPRTATVTALAPTTVTKIDKQAFDNFMMQQPGAALRIIMTLARLISFRLETGQAPRRN
ncbi:MAG TPA: cyclic nucleotide-binding domain-containing protein [bacterium]|nr:cyclic nucleotide-binding domain-containing protein [bacterium]